MLFIKPHSLLTLPAFDNEDCRRVARALDLCERDIGDHARHVAALAVELAEFTGEAMVHFRRRKQMTDPLRLSQRHA